jgi:hypothetical protein
VPAVVAQDPCRSGTSQAFTIALASIPVPIGNRCLVAGKLA